MHCSYFHFTPNTLNQDFYHYIPLCLQCMHACMHACIAGTFSLYQITWIRGFVIISGCFCNVCMHACMHPCIADTFHLLQIPWFSVSSLYSVVFAMHACMHCWYIQLTPKTLNQGFVIIICCVCNEYIHALLIHSIYTKYLESWFLSLYPVLFAMHECMHCWYIQLTTKTLNHGFVIISCCVCNEYIHALLIDTFPLHQIPWIRVFIIISFCVCNACMRALLLHSTQNK